MNDVVTTQVQKALENKDWRNFLRKFDRKLKAYGETEARRIFREELGLIYVKTYTVKAHFYRRRPPRSKP